VSDLSDLKRRLQADGVAISQNAAGRIEFNDPEGNRVVVSENAWN
jgi:phosphohistidine phosphatase SixA